MKLLLSVLVALQVLAPKAPAPVSASHEQPQGAHGLRNEQFGLFLRQRDASSKDGEPIVLYPYQPWKCMAWRFDNSADKTRLVNFFTGKSFQVQQSSTNKALVQMLASEHARDREMFHFIALGHNLYEIADPTGETLTAVDSDGHGDFRVVLAPWKDQASQRWQLVDLPDHFTM